MSRRVRTILTIELRIPQPPGYTQASVLEWVSSVLHLTGSPFKSFETQVKVVGKETTYLTSRELSPDKPRESTVFHVQGDAKSSPTVKE